MSLLESKATEFAAFRADDTLIDIIPNFDLPDQLFLSSSIPLGPFKAGLVAKAPLWIALLLEKRSFARISPPAWLNTDNLSTIVAFEKEQEVLYHDETKLPRNYYEVSKRLAMSIENADAISLLVQDILDIRMDKVRKQFQTNIQDQAFDDPDILLNIDTMGSQEIAILQEFVVTALSDQHNLAAVQEQPNAAAPKPSAIRRSRAPLRKFRR